MHLLIHLFLFLNFQIQQNTYEIHVTTSGIEETKGTIRAILFNSENGFPDKHLLGFQSIDLPVTHPNPMIIFKSLAPGSYGISVIHDVNDNRSLDTNWLGIPREPYGFSNDAKGTFGPPEFKEAAFTIADSITEITIHLK